MTRKRLDLRGRWRNKTIAFRISPEENKLLERYVHLSGLTKQDYITSRMLERPITVNGNPRVYKALRDELAEVLEQLRKIEELNNSIKEIDNKYFAYDEQFKRHTLKDIEVSFNTYSSNIYDIEQEQLDKLLKAGLAIAHFMNSAKSKIPEAQYMLIIEGQSSKDYYTRNYELSYERALALIKFWSSNGIEFDSLGNCEVLISGSGQSSKFRVQPDIRGNKDNQRFVMHIIPKPGIIE